jgi:hypothetical protein
MTKIETEMIAALAAHSGRVTQCRPGKARGAQMPKKEDRATQWLNGHRANVPSRDEKAERRKRRMARAEQDRIAKRNASVRKSSRDGTPQQPKWQSINKQR